MPLARHGGRGVRRGGQLRSSARRASWSAPGPFRRCRSASGTIAAARNTTRRISRKYPERLVPRRLVRAHRARHDDRLRPLRRDAQPGWRAHRHRRDLPRRWSRSTRSRSRSRSASCGRPTSRPTPASCCSCGCARATRWTKSWMSRSAPRSARTRRRATCRQRSSRSPTSRAPRTTRSSSSRCKAVVHGMPVANTDALANPEALELFRDLPELAA